MCVLQVPLFQWWQDYKSEKLASGLFYTQMDRMYIFVLNVFSDSICRKNAWWVKASNTVSKNVCLSDSATSFLVRSFDISWVFPLLLSWGDTNLSGKRFLHHSDEGCERTETKPAALLCCTWSPFCISTGLRNFLRKSLCPFTCELCKTGTIMLNLPFLLVKHAL